jgi:hypothetical protein
MLRRTFLHSAAVATAATALSPRLAAATAPKAKIAVGLDNYALRSLGWKAPELIVYAASLKCDTLFISDLDAFPGLDDAALRTVRAQADAAGLALYVGGWSICPTSKTFNRHRSTSPWYSDRPETRFSSLPRHSRQHGRPQIRGRHPSPHR